MLFSRRNFIKVALASPSSVAFAEPKPPKFEASFEASPGAAMDKWAKVIQPHVTKLNLSEQSALLQRNGVTNFQELSLTLAQRYPTLKSSSKSQDTKLKFLADNPQASQKSYEKSPSFDKEPYDKSPGYDRSGFDRSYEMTTDMKLVHPAQNSKVK